VQDALLADDFHHGLVNRTPWVTDSGRKYRFKSSHNSGALDMFQNGIPSRDSNIQAGLRSSSNASFQELGYSFQDQIIQSAVV
jgi:hypothetical protein